LLNTFAISIFHCSEVVGHPALSAYLYGPVDIPLDVMDWLSTPSIQVDGVDGLGLSAACGGLLRHPRPRDSRGRQAKAKAKCAQLHRVPEWMQRQCSSSSIPLEELAQVNRPLTQ
jgi:hypothetical protein